MKPQISLTKILGKIIGFTLKIMLIGAWVCYGLEQYKPKRPFFDQNIVFWLLVLLPLAIGIEWIFKAGIELLERNFKSDQREASEIEVVEPEILNSEKK